MIGFVFNSLLNLLMHFDSVLVLFFVNLFPLYGSEIWHDRFHFVVFSYDNETIKNNVLLWFKPKSEKFDEFDSKKIPTEQKRMSVINTNNLFKFYWI